MGTQEEFRLSRATRLQLGNVKSNHGWIQTAAGNHNKWGNIHMGAKYPVAQMIYGAFCIWMCTTTLSIFLNYRDCIMYTEHICIEDILDRQVMYVPGYARLRTAAIVSPCGAATWADPTPIDWLPCEIKLGTVKHASI